MARSTRRISLRGRQSRNRLERGLSRPALTGPGHSAGSRDRFSWFGATVRRPVGVEEPRASLPVECWSDMSPRWNRGRVLFVPLLRHRITARHRPLEQFIECPGQECRRSLAISGQRHLYRHRNGNTPGLMPSRGNFGQTAASTLRCDTRRAAARSEACSRACVPAGSWC